MSLNNKMAKAHEAFWCSLLGTTRSPGSGNQWRRPIDGRQNHLTRTFGWAFECKSTLGKSIGVSREMWQKARRQAGGERPIIPLRFYTDERLGVSHDLVVVDAYDFSELNEMVERLEMRVAELEAKWPTSA